MNVRSKHKLPLFTCIFLLAACMIILLIVWQKLHFIKYTKETYTESDTALSNPYIGWYSLHGYLLSDTETLTLPDPASYDSSSAGLVLLEINLKNYTDCDISDTGLAQLDQLLSAWQETGSQMILRFVYDWDGKNLLTEPQESSQIMRHMDQTGEIVRRYPASVYLMQGIFVGNWGEMNNTKHMADGQMTTLLTHLASVTDPSVFLAVRTPAQLRSALMTKKPLDASEAFRGTLAARLGLFNDGMLGSDTDTGTYGSASSEDIDYTQAWNRQDELAFQNALCSYVPNGGEVICDNSYNDLDSAITDLALMHVSYLNSAYDPAVLNKWKATAYTGDDTVYQNLNGYDYISRHLGYRYVLKSSELLRSNPLSAHATLSLTLENTGFSGCYRPLDLCVNMVSESGKVTSFPIDADLRFLQSRTSKTFQISLNTQSLESGTYTFYLQITDPALNREIYLANTLEHESFGYPFASARISKLSD